MSDILIPRHVADEIVREEAEAKRQKSREQHQAEVQDVIRSWLRVLMYRLAAFDQHTCVHHSDGTLKTIREEFLAWAEKPDYGTAGNLSQTISRYLKRESP